MEFLLVGLFELVVVVFYIFVSSVLLSHGLVGRWVNFSVGFFVVYLLVSFFLFGRIPVPAPVIAAFKRPLGSRSFAVSGLLHVPTVLSR